VYQYPLPFIYFPQVRRTSRAQDYLLITRLLVYKGEERALIEYDLPTWF